MVWTVLCATVTSILCMGMGMGMGLAFLRCECFVERCLSRGGGVQAVIQKRKQKSRGGYVVAGKRLSVL